MSKPENPQAFPRPNIEGMTLLDWFAIQILRELMLRHTEPGYTDVFAISEAYRLATLMLEARRHDWSKTLETHPSCRAGA